MRFALTEIRTSFAMSAGPGEPFATAAGVLGIMAIWRCVYAVFLDYVNARQWGSFNGGLDRIQVSLQPFHLCSSRRSAVCQHWSTLQSGRRDARHPELM